MSKLWILAVATGVAALPASVDAQFFSDNFDTYVTGSQIAGQGGWETWDNNPAANTTVVNTQAFTPPNSLLVAGPADIVHQFVGVTSGVWHAKIMTYVPSTQTGEMWFILMNTYVPNVHNNRDWSTQVVLCRAGCTTPGALPGMVVNLGTPEVAGGGSAPLITNQWVELRVRVDLAANQYSVFYNGALIDTRAWTVTGALRVQAFDLYSNASSQSFMDNTWLDPNVPVELMNFTVG